MKKIFWTSVFRLLVIFLFRAYVRVVDKPLGRQIGSRFGVPQPICVSGNMLSGLDLQLSAIQQQIASLAEQISTEPGSRTEDALFATTSPTKVALYYFNQAEDQKLPAEQQVNVNSILPVYRVFPASQNLLVDVIGELLKGNLTAAEQQEGFMTEFPNAKFKLVGAELIPDGTLTLSFTEVPGFTDGWSARMLILSNVIIKTAMQFPGVKKVVFSPDTLFQP